MEKQNKIDIYFFINNFIFIYMVFFFLAAGIYVYFREGFPEAEQALLDFFRVYPISDRYEIITEVFRSLVIAGILYFFYNPGFDKKSNFIILTGALWGLVVFCSVFPAPGNFEGFIYTAASFNSHLLVIILSFLQVMFFAYVFMKRYTTEKPIPFDFKKISKEYLFSFTALYAITYAVTGFIFLNLKDFKTVYETRELLQFFRSPDHGAIAFAAALQIIRGFLISFFIYPFYIVCRESRKNWLVLAGVLFGLTAVASPVFLHDITAGLIHESRVSYLLAQLPQAAMQILLFSWLFFKVEKKLLDYTYR